MSAAGDRMTALHARAEHVRTLYRHAVKARDEWRERALRAEAECRELRAEVDRLWGGSGEI